MSTDDKTILKIKEIAKSAIPSGSKAWKPSTKQEPSCWLSSTTIAVSPMFPSLSLLSSMWNHSWKEWRCSVTTM